MIHLHDVDVLLKLAACGLLEELVVLLGVGDDEVCILGTAIHKIQQLGRQAKYPVEVVAQAVDFCERHVNLPDATDASAFQQLVALGEGMEVGEAVMYSVALAHPGSLVVSGDKRAMARLGRLPQDDRLLRGLQGRVICFEELLFRYWERHGFDRLRDRCCQGLEADGVLRLCFRGGLATLGSDASGGLRSYWLQTCREAGGILVERTHFPDR